MRCVRRSRPLPRRRTRPARSEGRQSPLIDPSFKDSLYAGWRRAVPTARNSKPRKESVPGTSTTKRREPGTDKLNPNAFLPTPRRPSAQAPRPVPRQRDAPHRRGHGPRGLHRQRVDPLPPRVALSRHGARRLRADRARRVGAGAAHAPAFQDVRDRARRRRDHRPTAADVEQRRRDLALPAVRIDGLLLPQRRGRRGDLRPRGLGNARDDLRRPALQGGDYVVVPRGHDVPLQARRPAALSRLRDPGPDRDPAPLPQPVRAAVEGAPYYHRDIHPPTELHTVRERGSTRSRFASATATRPTSSTTTRSTSSAGTATSTRGRSRSTTSSRSPAASTSRRPRTRPSRARTS